MAQSVDASAQLANLELLSKNDPAVYAALLGEEARERSGIELIPSENYAFPEVLAVLGSVFTNKYSEGYPGRRYYGGQTYTDEIENLARDRAKEVFRCEHANVQPLSGSGMNQAVYLGLLEPGDTIMAMDLSHGGHLTHGAPVSHMGRLFNFVRYVTDPTDGSIDFDQVRKDAIANKPKMMLCGYTSYPRDIDYPAFKAIADEVGAISMTDASHFGGLVAGDAMNNPFDFGFDIVTTTTHKSLRGPRGGMVLCRKKFAKVLMKHPEMVSEYPCSRIGPRGGKCAPSHTNELTCRKGVPLFTTLSCRESMSMCSLTRARARRGNRGTVAAARAAAGEKAARAVAAASAWRRASPSAASSAARTRGIRLPKIGPRAR